MHNPQLTQRFYSSSWLWVWLWLKTISTMTLLLCCWWTFNKDNALRINPTFQIGIQFKLFSVQQFFEVVKKSIGIGDHHIISSSSSRPVSLSHTEFALTDFNWTPLTFLRSDWIVMPAKAEASSQSFVTDGAAINHTCFLLFSSCSCFWDPSNKSQANVEKQPPQPT